MKKLVALLLTLSMLLGMVGTTALAAEDVKAAPSVPETTVTVAKDGTVTVKTAAAVDKDSAGASISYYDANENWGWLNLSYDAAQKAFVGKSEEQPVARVNSVNITGSYKYTPNKDYTAYTETGKYYNYSYNNKGSLDYAEEVEYTRDYKYVEIEYTDYEGNKQKTTTSVDTQVSENRKFDSYYNGVLTGSTKSVINSTGDAKSKKSETKSESVSYSSETGKKTFESTSTSTDTYVKKASQWGWLDDRTVASQSVREEKSYDSETEEYTGKRVSEDKSTQDPDTNEILTSESSTKQYNDKDILTSSSESKGATTYNSAKTSRSYKSTGKSASYNNYGNPLYTGESSSSREDKLTDGDWKEAASSYEEVRYNKEGTKIYTSTSSSKDDGTSEGQTMYYDASGALAGGNSYKNTKTTEHSESYNRYGLSGTSDTTKNADGDTVKETNITYGNLKDGKNVISYESVSTPEYKKDVYDNKLTLAHTKSNEFDKLGGQTSARTFDEAYNATDDTITATTTTVNYVGKPVAAEMHDKVVEVRTNSRKNSDYSTVTTNYDWDGSVETIRKDARETVTDKNDNTTTTRTSATFEADGKTLISGSVRVNGTDENGNSFEKYQYTSSYSNYNYEYEWGYDKDNHYYYNRTDNNSDGTSEKSTYGYDKKAEKYIDKTEYFDADKKLVGTYTSNQEVYDKDKNYIGYDNIYADAAGKTVYARQVRYDKDGNAIITYVDGEGKEIGYEKNDEEKGVYSEKLPIIDTKTFTLTGSTEEVSTQTKGKNDAGEEVTYTVTETKQYNEEDILVYESKNDQYKASYEKTYTDEGKLFHDHEVVHEKVKDNEYTDKYTDTWYDNPGNVLSKVEYSPVETKDEKTGRVTSRETGNVEYYGLDGKLDRHTLTNTTYEYDKDGNQVKWTDTTEYRDGSDKAVVTRTQVYDQTNKNNWKTEYTTADGKAIGYTKYSGFETTKEDYGYSYSDFGTMESLTPSFNEYTGKVYSTSESKTVWAKDGAYSYESKNKDAEGTVTYDYTYKRDKNNNSESVRNYYYNDDNHLSQTDKSSYDAETNVSKRSVENYRYSGKVRSSWESKSSYDKEKDLTIEIANYYNSDGDLVYTRETESDNIYYGYPSYWYDYVNSFNATKTVYKDADGKEIGFATYAKDGSRTEKIPGITYSGNLSGAWTESTRSADGLTTSSKSYDKNGLLTSESSTTPTSSESKSYWANTTNPYSVKSSAEDGTGLIKTITTKYNEDGTQRSRTVTEAGRKTGTHFITTNSSYYDNNDQLVYTYEYVNDLQKDETTGIYKDASGKEIGHDRKENEDGSWSALYPSEVSARTGKILGFYEEGEDKDGNWYNVSYDAQMKATNKWEHGEDEEGNSIYLANGKKASAYIDGKNVRYNSKGEEIGATEYTDHSNGIVDSEEAYYNQNGELVYSILNEVDLAANRNNKTVYLDKDGKEIGYRLTTDDGYWTYKEPYTTYANNITGYHEYISEKDAYTERDYDAKNVLIGERYRKTTREITDETVTTTTTNKAGKVLSKNVEEKNVDNETVKSTTTYYSAWDGRYTGENKHYYDDPEYTAHKYIDENGNVTEYGWTWSNNDWYYGDYRWVNGQQASYYYRDELGEEGSHSESYNPDGSYSYWYDDDGNGNWKEWSYDGNGVLRSYAEAKDDVTNITYYDKTGAVSGYDWGIKQNDEYWFSSQDSVVWDANVAIYKKHIEDDPDHAGSIETWTDYSGNVKVKNSEETTVTLANMNNGWHQAFGNEWYYVEGGKLVTGWKQIGGTWYFFYDTGRMATGLVKDDNTVYAMADDGSWTTSGWNQDAYGNWQYVDANGHAVTGWQQLGGTWYYFEDGWYIKNGEYDNEIGWDQDIGGTMATGAVKIWNSDWTDQTTYFFNGDGSWDTSAGWKSDGIDWYYFDNGGNRAIGWRQIDGTWYYFNEKGVMRNGWTGGNGAWYYLNEDGSMADGEWIQERFEDDWYYADEGGNMATGWREIDGTWYFFNPSGDMAEEQWVQSGDSWYYQNEDGAMSTGWAEVDDEWYYMGDDGVMKTGWQDVGGTWYYFYSDGSMATGEVTIDGQVNVFSDSGAWQGTK